MSNKQKLGPGKTKSKMGRPTIDVDWKLFDQLAGIHCTREEIADILEMSHDTLQRACKREKGETFASYYKKKSMGGKMSLRRSMWGAAVRKGNPTMMIWLSKQHLGMVDQPIVEVNIAEEKTFNIGFENYDPPKPSETNRPSAQDPKVDEKI